MFIYRVLLFLAAPYFWVRLRRCGPEERRHRLGHAAQATTGRRLWIHAASNGEAASARPLVDALLARDPGLCLLVTCNSLTGRDLVAGWNLPRVDPRLAPIDYVRPLRRFVTAFDPQALILLENELWPNRIRVMTAAGKPVLVVSGRMSPASQRTWLRLRGLAQAVIGALEFVWPQDSASGARFVEAGLPEDRLGPILNLKVHAAGRAAPPAAVSSYAGVFPHQSTVLAASTHEGEEAIILDGFLKAREIRPELKLIIAPRHPRRSEEIQRLIAETGLPYAVRSQTPRVVPPAETVIYLADTLGEMALWYAVCGCTFVGGSLVPKGGHTPFEPAAYRSALLHGPHTGNFTEIYAALNDARAAAQVADARALADALSGMSADMAKAMRDRTDQVMAETQDIAQLRPMIRRLGQVTGNDRLV